MPFVTKGSAWQLEKENKGCRADIKGATTFYQRVALYEEWMSPGHWSELVCYASFSALTLMVGISKGG